MPYRKLYNFTKKYKKQVNKNKNLVYDAVDAFKTNKKDIHSPPVVAKQLMGIRRKGISTTLPTYGRQSKAYYSLLEYLCQVLMPFRV